MFIKGQNELKLYPYTNMLVIFLLLGLEKCLVTCIYMLFLNSREKSSDSSYSGSRTVVETYGIKALAFKGITSIAVGYLESLLIAHSMTSLPFWLLISTL